MQPHPLNLASLEDWWNDNTTTPVGEEQRKFGLVLMYVLWNIWKERNRRIFQNAALDVLDVASQRRTCRNVAWRSLL